MIGLIWNSVMSVAGGWFFLIAIESFTLGDKDFHLPGLGSFLATAYMATASCPQQSRLSTATRRLRPRRSQRMNQIDSLYKLARDKYRLS